MKKNPLTPQPKYRLRSFTLIELIIVIIIVGILATLGISQYARMVEKTRSTEAKMIFGDVRKLAYQYRLENGTIAGMTDAQQGGNPRRETPIMGFSGVLT